MSFEKGMQELVQENQIILGQAEEVKEEVRPSQGLQDLKADDSQMEDVEPDDSLDEEDQNQRAEG